MTTRRQTARRPGVTALRRARRWTDVLLNLSTGSGTGDTQDLGTEFTSNELAGMTVVRTIMCYMMRPNNPGGVSGNQIMDIGIGLFEAEAFAADVLPDVQTSGDYPRGGWLYRCRHNVQGTTDANGTMSYAEVNKDIRAQRRVGGPDAILGLVIFNSVGEGTAFTVQTVGLVRTLWLMP